MPQTPQGAYKNSWTLNKLLRGAGAGVDPTEIDMPSCYSLHAPYSFNAWTNMPAAETEFRGIAHIRTKVDLTNASQSRVTVRIGNAPIANAKIKVQYSTDESTWVDLCSVTMPATAFTTNIGAWTDAPAGAKADVFLRIVGIDGDGVVDPSFGLITLQVK